jgi:lipoprotein-releasing system permease protein
VIKRFFSSFEWTIAWRYLRSRRRDGFISVIAGFSFLGIMLGVATLIVVMAVMNGFRQELMSKILGVNGHAFIQPYGDALTDYDAIAKRVNAAKGVKLAAPIIEGQVLAASPSATSGALVRGVREADLKRFDSVAKNVIEGTLNGLDGSEKVAIGRRLAGYLNLGVGDKIRLLSPKGPSTPFGSAPRQKSYEIAAIFEVGMSEFDASFIFMPLAEAQLYFDSEGKVAMIEVFVDNPDRMDDVSPAIREAVGKPHALTDWRFRNRTFFGALEVERNVMFLILTMIVLVAALNIISGLTMLVKDKARGIAILRTMGATRRSILAIFMMTGAAIGVGGTFVGFLLGLTIAWNVESLRQLVSYLSGSPIFPPELYFLSRLPADVRPTEVVAIVTMALTLSLLATLYPAWRAARLDPVEALRGE